MESFFWAFAFVAPIWILFFQSRGLNLADIGFVAMGAYLASVLLEYPSGIFADKFSRKLSLIVSLLLTLVAYFVQVTANSTSQFFVGSLFVGAAWAFHSGSREALIYDSLKKNKLQKKNSKVLGELDTVGSIGAILSFLLGSVLFTMNNTYPYWMSIIINSIALFFLLKIKEPKFKTKGFSASFNDFKQGLKSIINNPTLKTLLLLYIPLFFFEEAWYNANQIILSDLGFPIIFLGLYASFNRVFFGVGGLFLPKLLEKFSHKNLIFSLILLEALVWVLLGTNVLFLVIIISYVMLLLHQFWNYVDADIIHDHISSNVRASTLSARQMLISIVWVFNPWLMGYLIHSFDRNLLFPLFGLIIFVVSTIVFLFRRKHI